MWQRSFTGTGRENSRHSWGGRPRSRASKPVAKS
jgi:hypothetical protein